MVLFESRGGGGGGQGRIFFGLFFGDREPWGKVRRISGGESGREEGRKRGEIRERKEGVNREK